jgi:putative peptidoglycan lipid II flippase
MVKKIRSLLNTEIQGLHQAAYVLGAFSILSQVFALIRDRLLAATFGAGTELDIYYSAFRLPDMLFVLLSTFVAVSVLVPLIVEKQENKKELQRYFNSVFTFVMLIAAVFFALAWVFAPYFLKSIVPEIYASHSGNLVMMTRILLLQPLLLSLSSFFGSFAQANRRFLAYATSPVVYNIGIILGVVVLYPVYGLVGLAYGVVLGALLHVGILLPVMVRDYVPRFSRIYIKEIGYLIGNSIPRTFAMLSTQVLLICMTFFAGLLAAGSISIFSLSYNLQSVPMAIIGVSYSLAAFPSLALLFQEKKMQEFYELLSRTIRHVFFWSLPVVACFIVLRAQIVRVILGSGNFDWNETILVAAALAIFTLSLIAQSASQVLIRAFYAMGKTRYPFLCAITSVFATLGFLSLLLIPNLLTSDLIVYLETLLRVDLADSSLILLLPIGFTIGQWVQFAMLLLGLGGLRTIFSKQFFVSFSQSLVGAAIIGLVSYVSLDFFSGVFDLNTFVGIASQGFLSGIIGLAAGFSFLVVIGNMEVTTVLHTGIKKIRKQKPLLQPEVKEEL